MQLPTRTLIHAGVNFVLVPVPSIDMTLRLNMERFMEESGLSVSRSEKSEKSLKLLHGAGGGLQVQISVLQPPQIGQLLILRPNSEKDIEGFIKETEQVVNAFEFAAQTGPRQIVRRDATIRCLYETSHEHAFQEIWEDVLEQDETALAGLQRRIIGGGLRLVLAPDESDPESAIGELKIESFLSDASKIYVETQFTWEKPSDQGARLEPRKMIQELDDYQNKAVHEFFGGEHA